MPAFLSHPLVVAIGSLVISYLTRFLSSSNDQIGTQRGSIGQRIKRSISDARWLMGLAKTGGVIAFAHAENSSIVFSNGQTYTSENSILNLATILSEGPMDDIEGI